MVKISPDEFALIGNYIEKNCGIRLADDKSYLVEGRLAGLLVENRCSTFTEFYYKAVADTTTKLRDKIIDAMTTNETLWFRDSSPFDIMESVIFPKMAEEIKNGKRTEIRIWSAACSTGQEPYSIAMKVHEFALKQTALKPERVQIVGTDISPTVLFLAMAGRYDTVAMSRGMPDQLRTRYFSSSGKIWVLNNEIKKMVSLKKLNLQEPFSLLGKQDIILCRNVLIYFSDAFKMDVLSRIARQLNPGGVLFLGSSEIMPLDMKLFMSHRDAKGTWYQV